MSHWRHSLGEAPEEVNPHRLSGRRLTVSSAVQLITRVAGLGAGVLVAAVLARHLGPTRYGTLTLALTVVNLAGNAADFGIGQVATREMAAAPAMRSRTAGGFMALRLTLGLSMMMICCLVGGYILGFGGNWASSVLIFATLPIGAITGLTVVAQARLRPEVSGSLVLAQSLVWLAAVTLVALKRGPLPAYAAGFLGAALLQGGLTLLAVRGLSKVQLKGAMQVARELIKRAWPIGVAGLFVTAYYQLDAVLVYHFKGPSQTAYYGSAYAFLDALQVLPATILGILVPLLAPLALRGRLDGRGSQIYRLALTLLVAAALPFSVGGVVVAGRIIGLVYGHRFVNAGPLLAILLPAFFFISLGYGYSGLLIAGNRVRSLARVAALALVVNIGANLLLIPRYGPTAAAATTVLTEVVVSGLLGILVGKAFPGSIPWGRWGRCVLASVPMVISALLLRAAPLPVALGVPAASYVGMLLVCKGVTISDMRLLGNRNVHVLA